MLKRTLDFQTSRTCKSRQGKDENVWIQRIQSLGSIFCEEELLNSSESERQGILDLSDRLRNIGLMLGLSSDGIQTIVGSRNCRDFEETEDTALVEEKALLSKRDRSRTKEAY
jgi:hypothetical protein